MVESLLFYRSWSRSRWKKYSEPEPVKNGPAPQHWSQRKKYVAWPALELPTSSLHSGLNRNLSVSCDAWSSCSPGTSSSPSHSGSSAPKRSDHSTLGHGGIPAQSIKQIQPAFTISWPLFGVMLANFPKISRVSGLTIMGGQRTKTPYWSTNFSISEILFYCIYVHYIY